MAAGKVNLRIAREFPFNEIAAATTYLEGRSALGKVVLVVNEKLESQSSSPSAAASRL
jgi:hypothetical protein